MASIVVWGVLRFVNAKRNLAGLSTNIASDQPENPPSWDEAVAKVKAERKNTVGEPVATPPELRHYTDRHWFLATQVAEVAKYGIRNCQDFLDLATMIERGEIVSVPAVTHTYVLYGVGETADESAFSRYEDGQSIEIYTAEQLTDAYKLLEHKRAQVQTEVSELRQQSSQLKKAERAKQKELQQQISARELDLKAFDDEKARLDQFYGQPSSRQELFHDHEALQRLAQNFSGRSYNIDVPANRLEMKLNMLRSLRPIALKVMEEIASAYYHTFDRPLPVSSLVRPEQYQRALRRVNRNAVLIETPPHSTGLAFDIDYRYMSGAEQNFLMRELARLKNEGRIEVIRERNANYHVFAFLYGRRPSDDLIAAAVEKASEPVEAHHASNTTKKPAKTKTKSHRAKNKATTQKKRHRR
jgi:hypothetical protein